MQNFEFYNPTRIVFGRGQIAALERLIPAEARVLILTGGNSARANGTLAEVEQALGKRVVKIFSGIEPNPRFETLMKAVELVRSENFSFLLAVGGGSVIDGTKFVAAAAVFTDDPWTILLTRGASVENALPFGTVLTLPATGSEMNSGAVINNEEKQAKLYFAHEKVFPAFSILDPTKTYTLPEKQIANGIVDAFVHVAEQYLTYPAQAFVQDRYAEGLLQTLMTLGPQALHEKDNYEVKANIMWVATQALNGLIGAGVPQDWSSHMLGHELTALYGLDHAQTLAIVLPAMLRERKEQKQDKLVQFAEKVCGIEHGSTTEKANVAIQRIQDFFEALGVKTRLRDYQLDASCIDAIIRNLESHGMAQLGEQQQITPAICRQVLLSAL